MSEPSAMLRFGRLPEKGARVEEPPLLNESLRKELVEYYKWVASLAIFILSTSLALANFLQDAPHKYVLTAGWLLLALSIVVNWLLVKSLISGGTIAATPVDAWTLRHFLFAEGWLKRLKWFGNVQQLSFVVGAALVTAAFVLRSLNR